MDIPPTAEAGAAASARRHAWAFAGLCLMLPALFTLGYPLNLTPAKCGELADSDCYMRLVRVQKLRDTGRWYDPVSERSNAPYGETLHWTRPLDALLLAGAAPWTPLLGFRTALFWWGVVLSPLLLYLTLLIFPWATRPVLRGEMPSLATLLLIGQVGFLQAFMPGRPDHHSLLLFLFVLTLGLSLRLVEGPRRRALCYAAGATGAVFIWTSVEGAPLVALTLGVLVWLWVWRGDDALDSGLHYSIALFVFLVVALLIERPPGNWTAVEFDRLSLVHVCIFGFIAAAFTGLWLLVHRRRVLPSRWFRCGAALLGLAAVVVAVLVRFQRFYRGPFADVDPRIVPIWLDTVAEFCPLLRSPSSWAFAAPLIGTAALCVPLAAYRSRHGPHRRAWTFMLVSCLFFTPLPFLQARWGMYSQAVLVLPAADLMAVVWTRIERWPFSLWRALAKAGFVTVCLYSFVLLAFVVDRVGNPRKPQKETQRCSLATACAYLEAAEPWHERRGRIVTHLFWGGEVLYRTHHEVIATPYHRNAAGIVDAYDVLTAATDEQARRIIRRRQANLILLCPESSEGRSFLGSADAPTFYRRLCDGAVPAWCRPVALPERLSSFLLFEVLPGEQDDRGGPGGEHFAQVEGGGTR